ncbi:MAG: transcriptional repressor NrdR [Planctomycetes bacterium]|nr:transcriptional repressor NrdR [Planctomycetota bacterium]
MQCLFCKADNDRVINSRSSIDGLCVKRRRECLECGRRFTTYERVEKSPVRVVKKDGSRDNFDRNKILSGLLKACEKRPVSTESLENIASEIESVIYDKFEREVDTKFIGELIMRKLGVLDKVAYVRFASVYREFKDIDEFLNELKPLASVPRKTKKSNSTKKEE